ncbi:MAG: hypothetical protein ACE5JX_19920 [Acidobacteriota bacterium]
MVQLLVGLFESGDPAKTPHGDSLTVGEFLERSETRVLRQLEGQPALQIQMKQLLGRMYQARSQYERAGRILTEALQQARAQGSMEEQYLSIFHDLASLAVASRNTETATSLLRQCLALHQRFYGPVREEVAQCLLQGRS